MDYQDYVKYEPFLARRACAATLDYLLYFAIFYGYVHFFGKENEQGMIEAKGIHHVLAVIFLWILYFPVIEGAFGFTLFKGLFDLKIVQERRKDFRIAVAFKRRHQRDGPGSARTCGGEIIICSKSSPYSWKTSTAPCCA